MHFTQSQFVLTLTAVVLSVGMLAAFFMILLVRYYRAAARQRDGLLRAIVETEERERSRIAEDLHDELGQLLSGVKLQVSALERFAGDEMATEVKSIKATLDDGMTELRRVVRNLVPRGIERNGLAAALDDMCARFNQSGQGTAVRFVQTGEVPLDQAGQKILYRMAQELVNNAVKHAYANSIDVTLRTDKNDVELAVQDDGRGYDTRAVTSGYGLQNVHNRAKLLGGAVHYTSTRRGTVATVRFKTNRRDE